MTRKKIPIVAEQGFIPKFQKIFLHPRYWGVWFSMGIIVLCVYIPAKWRDPILAKLGRYVGRRLKSARHRARVNLQLCFPQVVESQREEIIDKMFSVILPTTIFLAQLTLRGVKSLEQHVVWHNREILDNAIAQQQNIILFVPHSWAIDIAGVLLAAKGHPVAAMFHHQSNPVVDYLWNKARLRFGGRIHARDAGIRPFVRSVKKGYLGYYLPDEDHGIAQSEFVDFFATYKATLPFIGRLMELCDAKVIPLFPYYEYQSGKLHLQFHPCMEGLTGVMPAKSAYRMNQEIESLIGEHLEHYTWVLQLLRTRRDSEISPY